MKKTDLFTSIADFSANLPEYFFFRLSEALKPAYTAKLNISSDKIWERSFLTSLRIW